MGFRAAAAHLVITSYSIHYTKLYDPNFAPLYRELGYEVAIETRMRKAISFLKQRTPDVIVAEFNFQSVITSYSIHYTKLYE